MAYSQFHDGFWTDPQIRGLSSTEKLILIWFITNPYRHYSGVYFFEFTSIATQTGLTDKIVQKGIDTLSNMGWIKYSSEFSMVWVKKMARHEVIRGEKSGEYSVKQIKGIANHLEKLHKCPLIKEFLASYEDMKIPYQYPIRQEEEEVKVKEEEKSEAEAEAPPPPDGSGGALVPVPTLFYSCPHFDIDVDYFQQLLADYPGLDKKQMLMELKKATDYCSDNPKRHKRDSKGKLVNKKLYLRNWMENATTKGQRGQPMSKAELVTAANLRAAKEAME